MKYTFRTFVKAPAVTAVIVSTLALAIGANTAIFSLLEASLLRPLPFPNPDQLVAIESASRVNGDIRTVSPADWRDWSEESKVLQVAAYSGSGMTLRENDQVESIFAARVTDKFFEVLGVGPFLGRTFESSEFLSSGPQAVVLSHRLWLRRFGGDPSIVGKRLRTGETVVGVMPQSFRFPNNVEAWTPIYRGSSELNRRSARYWLTVGRLRAGQSLEAARAEMKAISARLAADYPNDDSDSTARVSGLSESLVRGFRPALLTLMGAVGFVLLIACANVAGLMLARSTARTKEVTVMIALGASRARLIGQFLIEGLVMSAMGAAGGLLLTRWSIDLLFRILPNTNFVGALTSLREDVHINATVVLFTVAISSATGIVFGLVPAISAMHAALAGSLREAALKTQTRGENRLHKALVVLEFASAVMLLAGAGLLMQSFIRMQRVDYGYDPRGLAIMRLPQSPQQNLKAFTDQAMEKIKASPGVESAALMSFDTFGGLNFPFNIQDHPIPGGDALVRYSSISADYFRVLKARMISGRQFNSLDMANAPGVAIINETLSRRYFQGENPVGKKITIAALNRRVECDIVGVVADIRQDAPNWPIQPEIFVHWPQLPWIGAVLVMRAGSDIAGAGKAVQEVVRSIDRTLPPQPVQQVETMLSDQVAEPRLYLILLGTFAAAALVLATIGVYGMLNYIVSRRTHEMAIRIAIGARVPDVVRFVIGEGMRVSSIGIALGLLGASALTRLMKGLLFGITAIDPVTFGAAALLLFVVAFLACYLPARRASKVDPLSALRYE